MGDNMRFTVVYSSVRYRGWGVCDRTEKDCMVWVQEDAPKEVADNLAAFLNAIEPEMHAWAIRALLDPFSSIKLASNGLVRDDGMVKRTLPDGVTQRTYPSGT
jgi:hypothetical protein